MSGYPGGVSKNELEIRLRNMEARLRQLLVRETTAVAGAVQEAVTVTSAAIGTTSVSTSAEIAAAIAAHAALPNGHPNYTHTQSVASALWTITHNLGIYPSVSVVDSAGTVCVGDVTYVNGNTVEVAFRGAFSGKAYLS